MSQVIQTSFLTRKKHDWVALNINNESHITLMYIHTSTGSNSFMSNNQYDQEPRNSFNISLPKATITCIADAITFSVTICTIVASSLVRYFHILKFWELLKL